MGQFKPMVKMETTEPSVILKLKKGGHVSSEKDENGHTNMKGAGFKAKYSEEACEGDSPKKPSMMERRKAMSGAMLNSKKGGKVEKKAMGGMMGAPAMPAPAMDPRKAAMMKAMMARKAAMGAAPAAPMAAPGMPAMKKGGKAMKHDDAAQDRAMIKKAMAGKKFASGGKISAVMDKTTVKGNEGAFAKTKMSTAKKDLGYEHYAAGGTVEGNEGAFAKTKMVKAKKDPGYEHYAEGGAAKKHYATGGSVSTGSAVAMPKHPVSKPIRNIAQSGTFKKGGKVRKFQTGGGTGGADTGTDMTGGGYDRFYKDMTEDNTKDREAILGLPGRAYSAAKRLLGMKPDAGAGRGNVNPPLVRKAGGSA